MKKIIIFLVILSINVFSLKILHAQENSFSPPHIQLSSQTDTIQGLVYYIHTISKGETLYSICKAYQCKESDITREHKDALVIGERLTIPMLLGKTQAKSSSIKRSQPDKLNQEVSEETNTTISQKKNANEKINISLILPLYYDLMPAINPTSKSKLNQKAFNFLPFYEGAKIAWLENPDLTAEMQLSVFDVTEDTISVIKVLKDSNFLKSDLIICAAFVKSFQAFNQYSIKNKIPIIHPLSERNLTHNNPYYIQTAPSLSTQLHLLASNYAKLYPNEKFILLTNADPKIQEKIQILSKELKNLNPEIKVLIYNTTDSGFSKLLSKLDKVKNNIVFNLFSKEIEFTNTILTLTKSNSPIHLICDNNYLNFNKIEPEYLQKLNCEYFDSFFVDDHSEDVLTFENNYLSKYHNLPTPMAYKGYDIMNFIIYGLFEHDLKFMSKLNSINRPYLCLDLNFKQIKHNGYENQYIHILKLIDFKFTKNQLSK